MDTGPGDDVIVHRGTASRLLAGDGADTVTLGDGAVVRLVIDGGPNTGGVDVLEFNLTVATEAEAQRVRDALAVANPATGSITINNQDYAWVNFEVIRHNLTVGEQAEG